MSKMPRDHAQLIEDTITEILRYGKKPTDARIALTCIKKKINEATIRKIAMWDKE